MLFFLAVGIKLHTPKKKYFRSRCDKLNGKRFIIPRNEAFDEVKNVYDGFSSAGYGFC